MKLSISKNANINYLAKVVELKDFHDHPDPEVTKLKCTYVDGYNIIVGIDSQPGKYVYFPTSSCINPQFLSFANLYRHGQLNANPEQTGMFDDNGRVKAIKLRGCISEGFLLPLQTLLNWIIDSVNINIEESDIENNTEFDTVEHEGKSFWVCKKYIVPVQQTSVKQTHYERRQKSLRRFNRIIDTQFRFHYDTILIKKIPNAIKPDDLIHMSYKIHGCVDAETIINTSDGKKTIKEIVDNKLPVEIEAFDLQSNQPIFVPIDDYYKVENDGEWYELELEDGRKLIVTGNNPIWLPELNCYRRCDQLQVGDTLLISQ